MLDCAEKLASAVITQEGQRTYLHATKLPIRVSESDSGFPREFLPYLSDEILNNQHSSCGSQPRPDWQVRGMGTLPQRVPTQSIARQALTR
jgi:hypothetical protein